MFNKYQFIDGYRHYPKTSFDVKKKIINGKERRLEFANCKTTNTQFTWKNIKDYIEELGIIARNEIVNLIDMDYINRKIFIQPARKDRHFSIFPGYERNWDYGNTEYFGKNYDEIYENIIKKNIITYDLGQSVTHFSINQFIDFCENELGIVDSDKIFKIHVNHYLFEMIPFEKIIKNLQINFCKTEYGIFITSLDTITKISEFSDEIKFDKTYKFKDMSCNFIC